MSAKDGKPCKKCGKNEWYKSGDCAPCSRERSRRWQADNHDRAQETTRRWRVKNKGRAREERRLWDKNNPEKAREHRRRWRENNPEKKREGERRWKAKNPEAARAHSQKRRSRKRGAEGSFTASEWKALVAQYNGHCCYPGCGRTNLQADHVVPLSKGGDNTINNIQPLCAYHNRRKHVKTIDYRRKPGFLRWIQHKLFD